MNRPSVTGGLIRVRTQHPGAHQRYLPGLYRESIRQVAIPGGFLLRGASHSSLSDFQHTGWCQSIHHCRAEFNTGDHQNRMGEPSYRPDHPRPFLFVSTAASLLVVQVAIYIEYVLLSRSDGCIHVRNFGYPRTGRTNSGIGTFRCLHLGHPE